MIDPEKYRKATYLKAADLTAMRTKVRIHSVTEEEVGTPSEVKVMLQFTNATVKPLVVNYTNVVTLVEGLGKDETTWPGKVIILVKTKANFQGKVVDAIRIEVPLQPAPAPLPPPADPAPPSAASPAAEPDEAEADLL
jgi:hypothetical protein